LEIPYKYGIFQPVGDTVGPAVSPGPSEISLSSWTSPRASEALSQSWVLNITNPMTVLRRSSVSRAARRSGSVTSSMPSGACCGISSSVSGTKSLSSRGSEPLRVHSLRPPRQPRRLQGVQKTGRRPQNANDQGQRRPDHADTHGFHVFKFEFFRRTGR
jgi:hypothetical protein